MPGGACQTGTRTREVDMKVQHNGAYTNGHTYDRVEVMDEPDTVDEAFWEQKVWPDTGDGVYDPNVGSWYGATIIEAENPAFVGLSYEWSD